MMSSAQLDILPEENGAAEAEAASPAGLRQQAAERLAAHRQRRARHAAEAAPTAEPARAGRRSHVAAAVADRFAHSQSYRNMLAEESQRAIEQALAAAMVAQRNAEAVAASHTELLAELVQYTEPVVFSAKTAEVATGQVVAEPAAVVVLPVSAPPVREVSAGGLTVRLYEDVGPKARLPQTSRAKAADEDDSAALGALDAEIAFRKAPVFEQYVPEEPATPIAANLLEFPRQLVAAKKSRPRLAEGPLLLEEAARSPQLRIFEVNADQPAFLEPLAAATEWSSIWLDAHTVTEPLPVDYADDQHPILASLLSPQVAPLATRVMAVAVDMLLVAAGFVAFTAAAARIAGSVPTGAVAAMIACVVLVTLYLAYQLLFFTFSGQTPGMRYARIGLCTFSDENPSRSAMRKRVLAQMVAVCPLGLGILWIFLDDDSLGWHDRISRMYQRNY